MTTFFARPWYVEGLYCKRPIQCLASSEILIPYPITARRVCTPPPPPLVVRREDTLAGWRGGGGSIVRKTPDTALYSIYVSTLYPDRYIHPPWWWNKAERKIFTTRRSATMGLESVLLYLMADPTAQRLLNGFYRGPGFLADPLPSVSLTGDTQVDWERETTCRRERVIRGWAKSLTYDRKKARSSINH